MPRVVRFFLPKANYSVERSRGFFSILVVCRSPSFQLMVISSFNFNETIRLLSCDVSVFEIPTKGTAFLGLGWESLPSFSSLKIPDLVVLLDYDMVLNVNGIARSSGIVFPEYRKRFCEQSRNAALRKKHDKQLHNGNIRIWNTVTKYGLFPSGFATSVLESSVNVGLYEVLNGYVLLLWLFCEEFMSIIVVLGFSVGSDAWNF